MDIYVTVRNRCAQPAPLSQYLVCGNSGYILHISFDAEWDVLPMKTVRLRMRQGDKILSADIPLIGGCCLLPPVLSTDQAEIGVFAEGICTNTPARIPCLPGIRDLAAEEYRPPADVLRLMLEQIAEKTPPAAVAGLRNHFAGKG